MANRRELKKDINYLAAEILNQAYMKLALMENVSENDIQPIMVEAIEMRNEFVARTNHPDGKDNKKIVKAYYQTLRKNLMAKTVELLDRIQALG
ncbi:hypothetical protein [Plebeiibacterium sediminum]|uniref:Uncharacterized protein n=1 Tax=Plebeiibacterium sediminum TaxID=2992112 RepID=A0AAE3M3D5_9BACT|nr:hypothetical protein [Plebeiobacterium sediminum]MCW3786025.1 hypothetical protein [Plebeiobacterium sediminum]